jgi:hypothetical protein
MKENVHISDEIAAHLRFHKKCEPTRFKGKGKGSSRLKVHDEPDKFECFPNTAKSFAAVCNAIQMDPPDKRPYIKRSQITWPLEGDEPTPRQIFMLCRCWDYLPRTLNKFVPPATNLNHALEALGRGHYLGYSIIGICNKYRVLYARRIR